MVINRRIAEWSILELEGIESDNSESEDDVEELQRSRKAPQDQSSIISS